MQITEALDRLERAARNGTRAHLDTEQVRAMIAHPAYPAGWIDGADDEQRAALGVVAIVDETDPADVPVTGHELVDVAGVPHRRAIVPPLDDLRAARLGELATIRWTRQIVITWRGRAVDAGDTATGRIVAALMRAQMTGGAGFPVRWKLGDGVFDQLSVADLTEYGMAIGAHWQACFDREAALSADITAAADVAAVMAIALDAGWPA